MGTTSNNSSTNARWWDEPKDDVHEALTSVFRTVRDECSWRVDADEYHAGLYCASDRPGVRGASRRGYEYGPATLPYNLCRSAVDTMVSKIAKQRPLPQCLTSRASWTNQKRAKKMTQFLEGEFYRQRVFEKHAKTLVRDACIFGRGILKVWTEADKVRSERVHPWEVFVDEWDGRYGEPRNLYHCRSMDRAVAMALFGRSADVKRAIEDAGRFDETAQWDTQGSTVDRVDIVEGWHLPSRDGAKDGRHVIVVMGATLVDERWAGDRFPFAILTYNDALNGYWGHGLVEQLEGYQYEINLASEKSSEQHRMSGVGVLVPDTAGIHDTELRNGITIIRHKAGGTPSVFQMDLVNEHTRQRPRELTQDGLNDAGLSQMSVQSQKPAGITAAIALQTLDDIETERFMIFGRAYEAFCLDVARLLIECAKTIAADFGDFAVSVPMRGGLVDLRWKDVVVDDVEIKIFPTSLLPQQLAARLEKLKDLWNTGLIDRATFLRQLDAPDLEAELDLETADKLVIDEMIERMRDAEPEEGDAAYIAPSAYQDFLWGAKRAQQKLNRGILDGLPEFNQQMLRDWIADCDRQQQKLAPANTNGLPVPGAPPPPGMAPPPGAAPPPPAIPDLGIPGAAPAPGAMAA